MPVPSACPDTTGNQIPSLSQAQMENPWLTSVKENVPNAASTKTTWRCVTPVQAPINAHLVDLPSFFFPTETAVLLLSKTVLLMLLSTLPSLTRTERPLGNALNANQACSGMQQTTPVHLVPSSLLDVLSVMLKDVIAVLTLPRFLLMMARLVRKHLTTVMLILKTTL